MVCWSGKGSLQEKDLRLNSTVKLYHSDSKRYKNHFVCHFLVPVSERGTSNLKNSSF